MKTYNISEAIIFLADEYGEENMPSSEETLRRAIRTKRLIAQEDGTPGRKGYSISEKDLRAYAERRLSRSKARGIKAPAAASASGVKDKADNKGTDLVSFPELYDKYIKKKISSEAYYRDLFTERMKWESAMHEKQALLARLNSQMVALESEIQSCQSAIDAYLDGISKFQP